MSVPSMRPKDVYFQIEMPVGKTGSDKTQILKMSVDPSINLEDLTRQIAQKILRGPQGSNAASAEGVADLAKRIAISHSTKTEPDVIHKAKLGEPTYPSLASLLSDKRHSESGTRGNPLQVKITPSG
ncbi:MAG: hypothetical protein FJZ59_04600 [Chlamydiae bacterium]|nr:hypothetical protein [Chlamydiota bacterium]